MEHLGWAVAAALLSALLIVGLINGLYEMVRRFRASR